MNIIVDKKGLLRRQQKCNSQIETNLKYTSDRRVRFAIRDYYFVLVYLYVRITIRIALV